MGKQILQDLSYHFALFPALKGLVELFLLWKCYRGSQLSSIQNLIHWHMLTHTKGLLVLQKEKDWFLGTTGELGEDEGALWPTENRIWWVWWEMVLVSTSWARVTLGTLHLLPCLLLTLTHRLIVQPLLHQWYLIHGGAGKWNPFQVPPSPSTNLHCCLLNSKFNVNVIRVNVWMTAIGKTLF